MLHTFVRSSRQTNSFDGQAEILTLRYTPLGVLKLTVAIPSFWSNCRHRLIRYRPGSHPQTDFRKKNQSEYAIDQRQDITKKHPQL